MLFSRGSSYEVSTDGLHHLREMAMQFDMEEEIQYGRPALVVDSSETVVEHAWKRTSRKNAGM